MKKFSKQVNLAIFLLFITLALSFLLDRPAKAATASFYFLPATGSYDIGKTFSVRLVAESDVIGFNLAEANLSFSSDTLQVVSLSKDGSIVKLWFSDPTFSNIDGTVTVSGGIPSPGYTGTGRVITITLKTIAAGDGWIKVDSGQILANDGQGTNILSNSSQATLTIYNSGLPQPKIIQPTPQQIKTTTAVKISSSTHSDPTKWYNNKNILLSWTWSQGITNYSFALDHNEKTIPDNVGEGMNTSVAYGNVDDGVWYFHLKPKTSSGWLSTINFKINIDSTAPVITKINLPDNGQTYNSNPEINIEANDAVSGIAYYTLKIDNGDLIKQDSPNYELKNVNLNPGTHTITVQVFDAAVNSQTQTANLQVVSLPAPIITYYTKQNFLAYYQGNVLIRGTSVPLAQISIPLMNSDQKTVAQLTTQADQGGKWTLNYTAILIPGQYTAYAVTNYQGQVSPPSVPVTFGVLPAGIKLLGYVLPQSTVVNLIIFLVCCILILLIILGMIMARIRKYASLQKYVLSKFNKKNKSIKVN